MAHVLVAYGTKNGGTAGIADHLGAALRGRGHDVDVGEARKATPTGYDALVVGSALYAGMWRKPVKRLLGKIAKQAAATPVWLFHSGPLGEEDADAPQPFPKWLAPMEARLDVRDKATFGGVLDETADGFIAKKMVQNGKGGDFRDWEAIAAWATRIADALEG